MAFSTPGHFHLQMQIVATDTVLGICYKCHDNIWALGHLRGEVRAQAVGMRLTCALQVSLRLTGMPASSPEVCRSSTGAAAALGPVAPASSRKAATSVSCLTPSDETCKRRLGMSFLTTLSWNHDVRWPLEAGIAQAMGLCPGHWCVPGSLSRTGAV